MLKKELNNPFQQSILIEAQASYYPHMVSVFVPDMPIFRKPETDSRVIRGSLIKLEDDADAIHSETPHERSIRRTKKRISDYALCNSFSMFITFTFANDRQNIDVKRQQMKNWLKNQRNRNGKFQYLLVPEFHKDKTSIHFHALFNNYPGKIERSLNPTTNKPVIQNGKVIYVLPEYTLGFNNVKLLGRDFEDSSRVAAYIQKYIVKDMPVFKGRQRYWSSKGLALPRIEDNPQKWYELVKPDWQVRTPNGKILRFYEGSHPLSDIYLENNK